jgi:hypothetical protein
MVDLSLVLDVSGSIGSKWPAVRDASRTFVNAFDEKNDRMALTTYGTGVQVLKQMPASRGFDKPGFKAAIPNSLPGGSTAMAEGLFRGWDEVRTVPNGQQSGLRVIVLFTDGASNSVPAMWDASGTTKSVRTADFPKNFPDPDNMTWDRPALAGRFHTVTGTANPSPAESKDVTSDAKNNPATTLTSLPWMPPNSFHQNKRSSGIPTSFPFMTDKLKVNGTPQNVARGLVNQDPATGKYPARLWNINNAARNLVEILADAARGDTGGDYPIRIYTIGMGELVRYKLGMRQETSEEILKRMANDATSPDFNKNQLEGKYYFAKTEQDVGPAFQALQNEIIRLTK